MRKIVNLTGFKTSDNQKDLGVIDLSEENREEVLKEVYYIPLFCVTKRYTMETIWSDWTPCRDDINYHYDFIEA